MALQCCWSQGTSPSLVGFLSSWPPMALYIVPSLNPLGLPSLPVPSVFFWDLTKFISFTDINWQEDSTASNYRIPVLGSGMGQVMMWNREMVHTQWGSPHTPILGTAMFVAPSQGTPCPQPLLKRQSCVAVSLPMCLCFASYSLVPICLPKAGSGSHIWGKDNKFIGWPAPYTMPSLKRQTRPISVFLPKSE